MPASTLDPQQQQLINDACLRALRLGGDGLPLSESLSVLAAAAEAASGSDAVASILLIDEQGLLRNGASPRTVTVGVGTGLVIGPPRGRRAWAGRRR